MKDIMTFSSKMLKNSNIQIKQGFKHMDKFQVDSNHHHHNHPHLKDHLCGEAHHVHVVNKPEVFDYKQLLTGNLNLNTIVNEGGNLFFDCPPLCYDTVQTGPQDNPTVQDKDYFSIVDEQGPFGQKIPPKSPRLARDEKGELIIVDDLIQEYVEPNIVR